MPMGITAAIYEGDDVTLRDYLMGVGRMMGFAVLQRDDAMSEPVKPTEERTSYYDREIPKLEARLAELRAMSDAEAERAAERDHLVRHGEWHKRRDDKRVLRERYEAMLAQVEAWQPDPLIESTKEQAIKYLRESIDFDCKEGHWDAEPQPVEGKLWRDGQIIEAEQQLARCIESRREDLERTEERNRYIAAFLDSLPPESVPA